jgi:hypothetical protein
VESEELFMLHQIATIHAEYALDNNTIASPCLRSTERGNDIVFQPVATLHSGGLRPHCAVAILQNRSIFFERRHCEL